MISVQPGIGAESIVLAFAVVVIGGLGAYQATVIAALLVGFVKVAVIHFMPELDLFSVYIVMAAVLIFRPKGIFSGHEARKYENNYFKNYLTLFLAFVVLGFFVPMGFVFNDCFT